MSFARKTLNLKKIKVTQLLQYSSTDTFSKEKKNLFKGGFEKI